MRNNLSIDKFVLESALNSDDIKDKQGILIYCADHVIHLLEEYIDKAKKYYITITDRRIREKAGKIFKHYENVDIIKTEYSGKSIKKGVNYVLDLSNQINWSKNGLENIGYKIDEVDLIHVITHGSLICNINDVKAREYFLKEAHVDRIIEFTNKEHLIKRIRKTYLVSIKSKNFYKRGNIPTATEFINYINLNGRYKFLRKDKVEKEILLKFKNWNPEIILNRNNDEIFEFFKSDVKKLPIRKIKYILCKGASILHPYSRKGNIFVINKRSIKNNRIQYGSLKKIKCSNSKYYQCYMLKKGDILISPNDILDDIVVFEGEESTTIIDSHMLCIRVREEINPYYVKAFLETSLGRKYIKESKKANMVKILDQRILENILIPMIPKDEQDKVVKYNLIDKVSKNISTLNFGDTDITLQKSPFEIQL